MPLQDAIESADLAALRAALARGVDPNTAGPDGETPLMTAAARGRIGIVRVLVRADARPEHMAPGGATALLRAAEQGRTAVFDFLSPLVPAKQRVRPRRRLKEASRLPDPRSEWLRAAVLEGRVDAIAELVRSDLDVDSAGPDGLTPLYLASARGDHEAVRLLVNAGADPNVLLNDEEARRREGALLFAWTPLMAAARLGHVLALQVLIDAGAELEARDLQQRTPLHLAAEAGHLEVVRALVRAGAVLDADDNHRHTAAVFAAQAGHDAVVNLLREAGAADTSEADLGPIALVAAASRGELSRVRTLLGRGVPVDGRDPWKRTALRMAASANHLEVVRALLDAGASVNPWPRETGPTPLSQAVDLAHLEVVEELLRRGADPVSQLGRDLSGSPAGGDARRQRIFGLLCETTSRSARPAGDYSGRGGVESFDVDAAYVFVEAPIDLVSKAMALAHSLTLWPGGVGSLVEPVGPGYLAFQLRGQSWTALLPLVPSGGPPVDLDGLGQELSTVLRTRAVAFIYSDVLNHIVYTLHEAGELTESFEAFDPENLEAIRKLVKRMQPAERGRTAPSEGRIFTSRRRKATARELKRELAFTEATFQALALFVPMVPPVAFRPGESIPISIPGFGPEDFERFDALVP